MLFSNMVEVEGNVKAYQLGKYCKPEWSKCQIRAHVYSSMDDGRLRARGAFAIARPDAAMDELRDNRREMCLVESLPSNC